MLAPRLIPCLDVRAGRVVKGVNFEGLRDAGDPLELARRYADEGADELVVLDVSATLEERSAALDTVERVRAVLDIPLCVGGGVDGPERAAQLLGAGADKVAINSAAVADPQRIAELSARFGAQCTVLSVDAARADDRWLVRTRSGTTESGLDAVAWAVRGVELGAGELLVTSIDRDGTRSGFDLDLIRAITAATAVPVIASGGARTSADFADAFAAGATGALAASIFHDGDTRLGDLRRDLIAAGVGLRPLAESTAAPTGGAA